MLRRRDPKEHRATSERIVSMSHSVHSPSSPLSPYSEPAAAERPKVVSVVVTPDCMDSADIGEDLEVDTVGNGKIESDGDRDSPSCAEDVEQEFLNRPTSEPAMFPRLSKDQVVGSSDIITPRGLELDEGTEDVDVLQSVNTIHIEDDAEDQLLEEENTEGIYLAPDRVDAEDNLDPFQTPD